MILVAGIACVILLAFTTPAATGPGLPDDVQAVIETSCYDCHSDKASSKKAKLALNFDRWDEYKTTRKISKLDAICEVLSDGEMPPEKYLNSKPDKALTDAQKKLVCDWTEVASAKLMEGE